MNLKLIKTCIALLSGIVLYSSCASSQKSTKSSPADAKADSLSTLHLIDSLNAMFKMDSADNTISIGSQPNRDTSVKAAFENYRASATMVNRLIHTELHVSFDYGKQYLYGKATITLKPYFYPTDSLILDAKGFEIHEISILKGKNKSPLKYSYDSLQVHIGLDKTYTSSEEYEVYIDYISKPNELKGEQEGSAAITSHKGLFFINPDGKDKNKPRQIWTQGETEDNSCWFPTIDKPNQRQTEEIYITVEKTEKTLSNGEMVSSVENKDNTRTDHWVMQPGIPPYLVMMAVGPFSIIHDKWRGKPVDYYLDAKYAPYAMDIFGRTPQMIEFFSNVLHFPYIWNKYDQVIVHDYVSGAMENTTATLHGDFLNQTRRELIDDRLSTCDDIISHELFHHWFGDLVTCESWSNIPLNESFATYGEYMWRQHAWGQDEADQILQEDATQYLSDTRHNHNLIDFYYNDREDVFDLISYQKGGCILHMLRNLVGDSAFFNSLHLYLETNKFTAVEAPELRLAFEKVTGEDLNWFFNEWFFNKGYPNLDINHSYNANAHKETVNIDQVQDLTENPVFYMPVQIDVYYNGKKESHTVIMDKTKNTYQFGVASTPDWVDVDAKKTLLCIKNEEMSLAEREYQYSHGPTYLDRYEAITNLSDHLDDAAAKATLMTALHDRFWYLRKMALTKLSHEQSPEFKSALMTLVNDSSSQVRSEAISVLSETFSDKSMIDVYRKALTDSSYLVESDALKAIADIDKDEAMKDAKMLENSDDKELLLGIAALYLESGSEANNRFFIRLADKVSGWEQVAYVALYGKFLAKCGDSAISEALPVLENLEKNGDNKYVKIYVKNSLNNILSSCQDRESELKGKIDALKSKNSNDPQIKTLQAQLDMATDNEKKINDILGQ